MRWGLGLTRESFDLSGTSVLLIDDNIHMRSILRSVMAGFGIRQVFEAVDGADGLEAAVERVPDLVLIDWKMTPLGGADFLRILRGESESVLNTMPVVVISAYCSKATIVEAARLGIHGFVAKPFAPAVLYKRITSVLVHQQLHGRSRGVSGLRSPDRRHGKPVAETPAPAVSEEPKDAFALL